jgi:hypothetical protein
MPTEDRMITSHGTVVHKNFPAVHKAVARTVDDEVLAWQGLGGCLTVIDVNGGHVQYSGNLPDEMVS